MCPSTNHGGVNNLTYSDTETAYKNNATWYFLMCLVNKTVLIDKYLIYIQGMWTSSPIYIYIIIYTGIREEWERWETTSVAKYGGLGSEEN